MLDLVKSFLLLLITNKFVNPKRYKVRASHKGKARCHLMPHGQRHTIFTRMLRLFNGDTVL